MNQRCLGRLHGKARREERAHVRTHTHIIHAQQTSKALRGKNNDQHLDHCVQLCTSALCTSSGVKGTIYIRDLIRVFVNDASLKMYSAQSVPWGQ